MNKKLGQKQKRIWNDNGRSKTIPNLVKITERFGQNNLRNGNENGNENSRSKKNTTPFFDTALNRSRFN